MGLCGAAPLARENPMTYKTNDPAWKGGYNGNQCPYGATPQQRFEHEQGRLQKLAEQQKAYENAWNKKTS